MKYKHPQAVETGTNVCTTVEQFIKFSENDAISWKSNKHDGVRSKIRCLQPFSDVLQVSLLAEALQFYSLHVTILNFLENRRKALIPKQIGKTAIVYFPLHFEVQNSGGS